MLFINNIWTPSFKCGHPVLSVNHIEQFGHPVFEFPANLNILLQNPGWNLVGTCTQLDRPDTSRRQWRRLRRLPPCTPLVIALVPLKCSSRCLPFPHRVPFTKEKMPWCPCPFKCDAWLKHTCTGLITPADKLSTLECQIYLNRLYSEPTLLLRQDWAITEIIYGKA